MILARWHLARGLLNLTMGKEGHIMLNAIAVARPVDRLSMLRELSILRELDDLALSDLARRFASRERPAGTVLVAEGEEANALFLIESGRARVTRSGEGGREVTIAHLRAGDVFGEIGLFDSRPQSTTVVAQTAVRMLTIGRDALSEHLQVHPKTAMRLLGEFARRMRRAQEVITDLALCDVALRLARTLVALAREGGVENPEGLVIRARPTQAELASMVGTCRETVSRQIAAWQRREWIVMRGHQLVISPNMVAHAEAPRRVDRRYGSDLASTGAIS